MAEPTKQRKEDLESLHLRVPGRLNGSVSFEWSQGVISGSSIRRIAQVLFEALPPAASIQLAYELLYRLQEESIRELRAEAKDKHQVLELMFPVSMSPLVPGDMLYGFVSAEEAQQSVQQPKTTGDLVVEEAEDVALFTPEEFEIQDDGEDEI